MVYGIIVQNNPINFVDPNGLEILIVGRNPFVFRYPGTTKPAPNQQYVPPRHSCSLKPEKTPFRPALEPQPNPIPPLPWWARLLKEVSDALSELGFGSAGAPVIPFDPSRPYASWDL
jgi:hypothetical protein